MLRFLSISVISVAVMTGCATTEKLTKKSWSGNVWYSNAAGPESTAGYSEKSEQYFGPSGV